VIVNIDSENQTGHNNAVVLARRSVIRSLTFTRLVPCKVGPYPERIGRDDREHAAAIQHPGDSRRREDLDSDCGSSLLILPHSVTAAAGRLSRGLLGATWATT
jgi:hypothetical protein